MNQIIIILLLCVFSAYASAQNKQANNWYFGHNAGITFNTPDGSPQAVFDGEINQLEGCASISDINGNLLFYTDGITVWNQLHDTMPNGHDLKGNPSASMSSLIVPAPANPDLYYIFTVPIWSQPEGLCYSVVDMNLDGGLGDVTTEKNIYLTGPVHEMVTSVRHADGQSFWVVSHLWESNTFVSFLIDSDSLHTDAVTCNIGLVHSGNPPYISGYMKLSPQGDKLIICRHPGEVFQLFDFDNETAQLSNPITFPQYENNDAYGVEFSPNGTKVYLSSYGMVGVYNIRLMQYDLSSEDSLTIVNSGTAILSIPHIEVAGALQAAPDNKIYFSRCYSQYLSAINYPDSLGISCGFVDSAVYLDDGTNTHNTLYGLPAFIQSFFNQANFTWEGHCIGDTSFFAITDTASQDSVFWDFGDPASGLANYSDSFFPYHIYEDTGAYQVSVIGYNNNLNDTTVQEVFIHPLPVPLLPADTGFCEGYGVNLWPGDFQSYLWQNGSTDTSFYADTTLNVIVEVTDMQGCKTTDSTHALEHSKPLPVVIYHD